MALRDTVTLPHSQGLMIDRLQGGQELGAIRCDIMTREMEFVGEEIRNPTISSADKPERTRNHYIDALGRNHVERFILLRGHVPDEPRPDYGYDIVITTFDYKGDTNFTSGEVENGWVYVQLKSTDILKVGNKDSTKISFDIKRRHLVYWADEPMPVILIVYSVPNDKAYWLHMQPYLKSGGFMMPPRTQEKVTVHLSTKSVVDEGAIETFRAYKADVLKQILELNVDE